jgi:dihydroorotase
VALRVSAGRVLDPANGVDKKADLFIDKGKIVAIGKAPRGFKATGTIDAAGKIVCPGLVDIATRLREPGEEHKATIKSETRAAASAGITTLCCLPDTEPVIDTPAVAELIQQRAKDAGFARVVCVGALTQGLKGECLAEMAALAAEGCVGVSNAMAPVSNTAVMRSALEYATSCNVTVFLNAEDAWLAGDGHMHEGGVSARLGIPGISETAETVGLSRDLLLLEQSGTRAHFARISTARATELLRAAQKKHLPISADVAAHQLFLTDQDVGSYDPNYHVRPPLRSARDRSALRRALKAGVIEIICSDHQPHDIDAKTAPFSATLPGISALETLLPLTLKLVEEDVLDLSSAIAAVSAAPARLLGLNVGQLGVGSPADICIFDPHAEWQMTESNMLSAGKNSPFIDQSFKGRATHTIFAGRLVYGVKTT